MRGEIYHPVFGETLGYEAVEVPDDPDQQVAYTIQLMAKYARQDADSPVILSQAQGIWSQVEAVGGSGTDLVCAVWAYVREKIGFVRDEVLGQPFRGLSGDTPVIEVLIRPRDMAVMQSMRAGDCDDYAMYAAALLTALNIPTSFVTIAADGSGNYSHVYLAAYPPGGKRIALDTSHGPRCGWEAKEAMWVGRTKEWPVSDPLGDAGDGIPSGPGLLLLVGALIWGIARFVK